MAASDAAGRIGGGNLIVGFGYDDAQLKERRHPTRQELDAVSKDLPVLILHQSDHLGVANTQALEMARITAETKDPSGGVIRREADGKTPNGVLEEAAWFPVVLTEALPLISEVDDRHFIEQGQRGYVEFGFTTAQEGRATSANVKALADAASVGVLTIDVVAYPDPFMVKDVYNTRWHGPDYKGRFRVGGSR
jgi:predicted amidohydrolase YtcJ